MKYLKIISIIFVIISLSGCEDLTEDPKSVLTQESFFKTESDLEAAVIACYNPLMGNWNGLMVRTWSLHMGADDMTSARGYNKERLLEFDEFRISTNNSDNHLTWTTLYQVIAACNSVIANAGNIDMEDERRDQLTAQSYFLRAYCYFSAVRYWGDLPLIANPVEDGGLDVVRAPKEDVYNLILSDLEFAEEKLPVTWSRVPGTVTKGAAKTLLANVYLTMAGWPLKQTSNYALAAEKAKEVMDLGIYSIVDDYKDLFNVATKNNKEHIWNVQAVNSEGYFSKFGISWEPPEDQGWHDNLAEVRFFENYPDNARKQICFYTVFNGGVSWEDSQIGLPCFQKYWEEDLSDKHDINGDHLYPVFRYAEVLLIYAEAQNRVMGGPDQSCYTAVNSIRARANGGIADDAPTGLSEAEFDQLVFDEKGWEFAAEQKRWHDLVRKELVNQYNANNPYFSKTITEDNYIFPIPAQEREINPNLTQNPGY